MVSLQKPGAAGLTIGESKAIGLESSSADAQDMIRRLNERIRDLEQRNSTLKDLVESLKSTFDFFEIANDQFILQRH